MNINIRNWKLEDAKDLAETINNKKIQDNLRDGIPYPYTKEDATEFINIMLSSDKNKTYAWAIVLDDKVIGSIAVFRKDNIHKLTSQLGYYIKEEHWGKGIGSIAIKKVCEYIFTNTDILRIEALPFEYNIASTKLLEKCNFKLEGILKKNAIKNGKVLDMFMYSLIKDDKQ